jgi:hypothetical protein
VRPDSITLAIFEKYSPEEMTATAQKLVQALTEKETAETEKKLSDAAFKERINKHEAEAADCAKRYAKGGETAQIGCAIRYDVPKVGQKSYIRMDREEVVEVHDMSLEEKQETLQFPLTASADAPQEVPPPRKTKPKAPPAPEEEAPPINVQTSEFTFRDIQAIAANLVKLDEEHRPAAIADMQNRIAITLFVQKGCIGPDGRVETIDSQTLADALAAAWLKIAVETLLSPPPAEEVTRICPYPGCIDFADHEGEHRIPTSDQESQKADSAATPEPKPEPERKPRKRRPHAPPIEPPCQEPPAPGPGMD